MNLELPTEVSAELDRILGSRAFSQTTRQSQFLRFIVTETAQGRGEDLKEYLIGTRVFQKPSSFDPRLDSIVRVEAARLRARLKIYYETEGKDDPVWIILPSRGYRPRWEARTAGPAAELAEAATPQDKAPTARWSVGALIAVLIVVCGAALWAVGIEAYSRRAVPATEIQSVVVLGFRGEQDDPEMEYLREGATESIIAALSQPRRLRVVATSRADSPDFAIGNRQGIDAVITGSVRKSKEQVRITANVVRCSTGEYLWSGTFERNQRDIFQLQNEVAVAVLRFLVPGAERGAASASKGVRPEAYKEYLTARNYLYQRSEKSLQKAIGHFERAITLDPGYGSAYAGLASAYSVIGRVSPSGNGNIWLKAKRAATEALERDERLAEAHTRLAGVLAFYQWDWAAAEPAFQRAIEYDPNNADAHHNYAHYLIACSRLEEALKEMRRAQELEPVSPIITAHVGLVYYMMREYDQAIDECRKALEMSPGFYRGNWEMARAYLQKSMPEQAIAELEKAKAGFTDYAEVSAWLAAAHARRGYPAEARRLLQNARLSAFDRSVLYSGLGDRDATLLWLGKSCDEHSIWSTDLNVDPMYDWLRSDARFHALVKRLRL